MKQKRTNTKPVSILRRMAACLLAVLGLWMLSLTTPPGWLAHWGGNARLVTAALATSMPMRTADSGETTPNSWQRMLLGESALLSGWNRESPNTSAHSDSQEAESEPSLPTTGSENIVERFFQPNPSEVYNQAGEVYILNKTKKTLDVAALASAPLDLRLPQQDGPEILIMHTHGSEAYAQEGTDVYNETDTARTTDTQYNIIRVGDEIERIFTELGLSVLHDRTLYDYPSYNGAYDRSREAVEQYLKDYPSIKIVLDIHRDALVGEDGTIYKAVTEIDGVKTAQVLMVMGSDDGGLPHPNWDKNLSLAMRIQHRMNTLWPGLARPIILRSSRFNQQLTEGSLLVEVGSHGNTLQEALSGARSFARAAGQVFLELRE
ncbi:MAG: stage sporulation protein [Firmicutes bacterium]|nr:stage sporulation protein [Bacillota bacterium]